MVDQVRTGESATSDVAQLGELRMLPLSSIKVIDGFNPRTDVERAH